MKDDMTIDSDNIREILEIYARRNDYKLGFKITNIQDPTEGERFSGFSDNKYCNDHLSVYVSINNNRVTMKHFGDYCALAHASAEMFCETIHNEEVEVVKTLLLGLKEVSTLTIKTMPKESNKFEKLFTLLMIPMSATRKYCVALPWKASIDAWNIHN